MIILFLLLHFLFAFGEIFSIFVKIDQVGSATVKTIDVPE